MLITLGGNPVLDSSPTVTPPVTRNLAPVILQRPMLKIAYLGFPSSNLPNIKHAGPGHMSSGHVYQILLL